jgi:hypothetical protein
MLCNRSDSAVRKIEKLAAWKILAFHGPTAVWLPTVHTDVLNLATAKGAGVAVEDAPNPPLYMEKDEQVYKRPSPWLDVDAE